MKERQKKTEKENEFLEKVLKDADELGTGMERDKKSRAAMAAVAGALNYAGAESSSAGSVAVMFRGKRGRSTIVGPPTPQRPAPTRRQPLSNVDDPEIKSFSQETQL